MNLAPWTEKHDRDVRKRDGGLADQQASLFRCNHPRVAVEVDDPPLAHGAVTTARTSSKRQLVGRLPSLRQRGVPLAVLRITVGRNSTSFETESRHPFMPK